MKFANYEFYGRNVNNLGDNMQIIAIDHIYNLMGVSQKEIVYINKNDLSTYRGEYVVLPVTMPLIDYTEGGISGRFSDHIVPVFLGLTLAKDTLMPEEVKYYIRYEPIGCRDERTLKTMRKYGIQSYLHGCITASLPQRDVNNKSLKKVFIVDVDPEVLKYVPDELMKDSEFMTHMHENVNEPKSLMKTYYNKYKEEGKLIITSLLHCSVPCMAAGIPTILIKKRISYRFGWLEKLMPIYDFNDFEKIDWKPKSINYEKHKESLLQISINRLRETYKKFQSIYDLSWFYEQRNRKKYIVDAFDSLKQFIDRHFEDDTTYSIWGLTQVSELAVKYIKVNFPKAKLMHIYDSYRNIQFEGINSELPEKITKHPEEIVLVTSVGARKAAEAFFDQIGKKKGSYAFYEIIK